MVSVTKSAVPAQGRAQLLTASLTTVPPKITSSCLEHIFKLLFCPLLKIKAEDISWELRAPQMKSWAGSPWQKIA